MLFHYTHTFRQHSTLTQIGDVIRDDESISLRHVDLSLNYERNQSHRCSPHQENEYELIIKMRGAELDETSHHASVCVMMRDVQV